MEFMECLVELVRELDAADIRYDVHIERRTVVHQARELITERAIMGGYSHVLWLDSDMVFDADCFRILLQTMQDAGADMVSGIYRNRHGKCGICLWSSFKPDVQMPALSDEEVFAIAGCGFGCVLTTVRLLDRVRNESLSAFQPLVDYGEDLAFCYRAGKLGAKLVATARVKCGHVATVRLDVDGGMTPL